MDLGVDERGSGRVVSVVAELPRLVVVVGSGGVGKTTLAGALGLRSAAAGADTLVMTFDPSLRLREALGVGEEARDTEIEIDAGKPGRVAVSLLDARLTFDRLIERYSSGAGVRDRILENRYYHHLAGGLAGILEYMAVERLFEVAAESRYDRVVLDTPPTRQAIDFLEAPARIVEFLDSGAVGFATRAWFDSRGRFRPTSYLGGLGRRLDGYLDEVVGLDLLRDMVEFFQAFEPLFEGFRARASEVRRLLTSPETRFLLVSGAGEDRVPDTLFFARRLEEAGHHLGPIVVNRLHPSADSAGRGRAKQSVDPGRTDGRRLLIQLARREAAALEHLESLLSEDQVLAALPLLPEAPTGLEGLDELGRLLEERLGVA
ncbi:MAG: hypothetical protein OES47_06105 [Acidobacteriota bacterium]|nr:hypothetical protein [Acidobacteriota bacterium]